MYRSTIMLIGAMLLIFGNTAVAASVYPGASTYVPIMLTNGQTSASGSNFQQMITFNTLTYSSYLANNLQNVEFAYQNGTLISSWLESLPSVSSNNAVYWLNIANGIAASNTITVYMVIAPSNTNLFDGINVGEAPKLSSSYGQYDNGNTIFNFYDNFSANANGWGIYSNGGTESISNGISLTANSGYHIYLSSNAYYNPQNTILESLTNYAGTSLAVPVGWNFPNNPVCWIENKFSSAEWENLCYAGGGIAYNNIQPTSTTPSFSVFSIYINNSVSYAMIQYANLTMENSQVGALTTITSAPIAFAIDGGGTGTMNVSYVRVRQQPPNDIMPSTSFGSVQQFIANITPYSPILDAGQSITLTANVVGGNAPFTYSWSIKGKVVGTSSTYKFITKASTALSTNIILTVSDAAGPVVNSRKDMLMLTEPMPTVTMTAGVANVDIGQAIGFTATIPSGVGAGPFSASILGATNTIPIGGGTVDLTDNTHKGQPIGNHKDCMSVVDKGTTVPYTFTSSSCPSITLNPAPTVKITANATRLDAGQYVRFTETIPSGVGFGPFTVNLVLSGSSTPIATNTIPIGGGSVGIVYPTCQPCPENGGTSYGTDQGTSTPYNFKSASVKFTVKAAPTLTLTSNVASITPGNSILFTLKAGKGGWGPFAVRITPNHISTGNTIIAGPSASNMIVIAVPVGTTPGSYTFNAVGTDEGTIPANTFNFTSKSIIIKVK